MDDLIKKAKFFSIKQHFYVNHKYDKQEYCLHLQQVYNFAIKYKHLINQDILIYVLASSWTHDTIEDARITYSDIKKEFGEIIADITYALTNEKGKTREERANDKYYNDMKLVDGAVFIKICDRLANLSYSYNNKSSMLEKYSKEYKHFKEMLYDVKYDEMFKELEKYIE
jgi:(p)ppGpp synthase/HD superfamily hydrolase